MTYAHKRTVEREIRRAATHDMKAVRVTTDDYEYGEGTTESESVILEDEPVMFLDSGSSFIRTDTGERVTRPSALRALAHVASEIEEGDNLTLTPKNPENNAIDDVEVRGITEAKGPRGQALSTKIEIEDA